MPNKNVLILKVVANGLGAHKRLYEGMSIS